MLPLPEQLITSLRTAPGFNEETFRQVHQSGVQVVSIRINPAKPVDAATHFIAAKKIPWASHGYYLQKRPSFTADPLFAAGCYYVQEAGSMFLEEVMRQTCALHQPLCVLDLCAAPGGKSTLIQSIISADSLLVSNELIKTRANILAENMTKWGAANVIVTSNEAKDFKKLPQFFDVIVADAPCSGSGLFRKDNEAIGEWSLSSVAACSLRQQRILADVLPALKPGGILIYSTCSYSEGENEFVADDIMRQYNMEPLRINLPAGEGIIETISPEKKAYGYRFYPDKIQAEGFFIAAFKLAGSGKDLHAQKRYRDLDIPLKETAPVLPFIQQPHHFSFIKQEETILAFPKVLMPFLQQVKNNLYIKKAGVAAGCIIKGQLVPDHELAVSSILSEELKRLELTEDVAMDYLRRNEIKAGTGYTGWAVVCFKKYALGLVKVLPSRVNNYYPKSLRILNK